MVIPGMASVPPRATQVGHHVTPDKSEYPGWRFNNIQPVTLPDGGIVDGMLLFYGWKDKDAPEARAFLLHEEAELKPAATGSAHK